MHIFTGQSRVCGAVWFRLLSTLVEDNLTNRFFFTPLSVTLSLSLSQGQRSVRLLPNGFLENCGSLAARPGVSSEDSSC